MNWKLILKRLQNTGTLTAVISSVGLLLVQFGVKIDLVWLDTTIKIVCVLGVALGVLNNPDTKGSDLTKLIKK